MTEATGPLAGVGVIDAATLFAGPLAATFLGDLGADVVKIEHPSRPDAARSHGPSRDGVGLWWKTLGRNKRTVTLDLSMPEGADVLLRLAARSDVLIENFRPGTLERWGIGPDALLAANPRLVIARVTAFGQHGPYAKRPGFGSIAEAMSGFAAITGEPDGPPTLPPFGLADGIAALATSMRHHRSAAQHGGVGHRSGHRHGHHRADPHAARRPDHHVRPARHRAAAPRQPVRQQRPAQRVPDR